MASIFVQIASYHDYELPRTILDCMNKSSGENIINFGVHLCYVKDDIFIPDLDNIKLKKSKAPENIGVGPGRFIANSFYNDEDYYLQIDSHTRFDKNWDLDLIESYSLYKSVGCDPVLSTYPGQYFYKDYELQFYNQGVSYIEFNKDFSYDFKNNKILPQKMEFSDDGSIFIKSIAAGLVFGEGKISKFIIDKNVFYWGEETLMAINLFMAGYDLMIPKKQVIYHLYYDHEDAPKNMRHLVWDDFPKEVDEQDMASRKYILFTINNLIQGVYPEWSTRTFKDFEYYAGVDFDRGALE